MTRGMTEREAEALRPAVLPAILGILAPTQEEVP